MSDLKPAIDRAWSLRAADQNEEAERILVEAVNKLRRQGTVSELTITALRRLGHVYLDRGAADQALVLFIEGLDLARSLSDELAVAHMTRHVGDAYRASQQWEKAIQFYRESLKLYRTIDSPPRLDLANSIRMVALVEERLENMEEAIQLWTEAGDIYASVGITAGTDEALSRIATLSGSKSDVANP